FGAASGGDPMCLDKQWQAWAEAWMSKGQPKVTSAGVAYMLKGDRGASNSDPFATGPTANNAWVVSPPHIMMLYQDLKMLEAFPTDPKSGGPWVMWKGTPYAHLMVPVSGTKVAKMPRWGQAYPLPSFLLMGERLYLAEKKGQRVRLTPFTGRRSRRG